MSQPRFSPGRFPVVIAVIGAAAIAATVAMPAEAQDEAALRAFFEGKRIGLKIDMPGTSDGVDVRADSGRPLDYQHYGDRLKSYGAAIRAGESATVTYLKVKKDLIELHLDGGGFGTFGDDSSTSVNMPHVDKSSREKDLEKKIKDEDDSGRRRRMERERDDLRDDRERENRRIDAERAVVEERKKERIAELRLRGGSRFNLRYDSAVPRGIRPDEVMAALAEYVDFSTAGAPAFSDVRQDPSAADLRPAGGGFPRKGMTRAEAERELGRAVESSERRDGSFTVVTVVFLRTDLRITADFIEDVLIRYGTTSR